MNKKGEFIEGILNCWQEETKEFNEETILKAINESVTKFKFFPNIGEFKSLCNNISSQKRKFWGEDKGYFADNFKIEISNRPIGRIIAQGEIICKKLKKIFPEDSWMKIASKFSLIKSNLRSFYDNYSEIDFLNEISKYPDDELKDSVFLLKNKNNTGKSL